MKKAIITVVGHDTVGIIASVCSYLADQNVNILDISQTIVNGYFNMMMIADVTEPKSSFSDLVNGLDEIGKKVGVVIHCQREDIFDSMHRLS